VALRRFVTGRITNFEFEDQTQGSRTDPGVEPRKAQSAGPTPRNRSVIVVSSRSLAHMRTSIDWPHLLPFAFPILFVGLWLLVGWILSRVSGWAALAERFPAGERPLGRKLRGQVVAMGPVSENGVTGMIVVPQGLYLYANPLFRFGRRPLLLPWHAVAYRSERKMLWWRSHELDLGGLTTLRLQDKAFREIAPHLRMPLPTRQG
jgi:hypothetical protein